jgi:tetratricopeptide (TPR) repeat protein
MPDPATPSIYDFGEFFLDTTRMMLLRHDGEVVPLQPKAFDLLRTSVESNGRVCQRGYPYMRARRCDEAMDHFRRALEMEPDFPLARFYLGKCYAEKARYEEAAREHRRAIEASGESAMLRAALAFSYARSGRVREARAVLAKMNESARRGYVSPYSFATIYAGLGDSREALMWLQRAFEDRDPQLVTLKDHIHFDGLRHDPQFADLVHRVGLAP